MPSLIDSILDDTGPVNTPAATPVTTGTGTTNTTTFGTPKTFPTGDKIISITGPATTNVGTPTVYKVSGSSGYSSWVGQDPNLTISFVLYNITAAGSLVLSSNFTSPHDKYTFTPTTAGDYQIVAYAKKSNECDDANTCPRVSVKVTVTAPSTSTSPPPASTSPPPASTSPTPTPTSPPPASTSPTPTPTNPAAATLSTDDFKTLNTNLKTVNTKLNSLYNQIQGLRTTTNGMNTQLTSIENVTTRLDTMINTIVTSLQNTGSETGSEELPVSEGGGYRRTSRRNKIKRSSTFRKKFSKL